jgi:hypothetical protein
MSYSGQPNGVVSSCVSFSTSLESHRGSEPFEDMPPRSATRRKSSGCDRREHLERRGRNAVVREGRRCEDQLSHQGQVADRKLERDGAAML